MAGGIKMPNIGQRKFVATSCVSALILGLSFLGLLWGKLSGSEFISAVNATCFLVGGFLGLNVTSKLVGKMGDQS